MAKCHCIFASHAWPFNGNHLETVERVASAQNHTRDYGKQRSHNRE